MSFRNGKWESPETRRARAESERQEARKHLWAVAEALEPGETLEVGYNGSAPDGNPPWAHFRAPRGGEVELQLKYIGLNPVIRVTTRAGMSNSGERRGLRKCSGPVLATMARDMSRLHGDIARQTAQRKRERLRDLAVLSEVVGFPLSEWGSRKYDPVDPLGAREVRPWLDSVEPVREKDGALRMRVKLDAHRALSIDQFLRLAAILDEPEEIGEPLDAPQADTQEAEAS